MSWSYKWRILLTQVVLSTQTGRGWAKKYLVSFLPYWHNQKVKSFIAQKSHNPLPSFWYEPVLRTSDHQLKEKSVIIVSPLLLGTSEQRKRQIIATGTFHTKKLQCLLGPPGFCRQYVYSNLGKYCCFITIPSNTKVYQLWIGTRGGKNVLQQDHSAMQLLFLILFYQSIGYWKNAVQNS